MSNDTKAQNFLRELKELFQKHNATLEGCGCCESPHITAHGVSFGSVQVTNEGGTYASVKGGQWVTARF